MIITLLYTVWRSKLSVVSTDINPGFIIQWPHILAAEIQSVETESKPRPSELRAIFVNQCE